MDIPIDKYDVSVGLFVFMGLLAVVCLTVFLAGPDLFDIGSTNVKTYLPQTYGLKRGVPVSYLDFVVGHVKSVTLTDGTKPEEKVEVVFTIRRKYQDVIRKNFQTSLEKEQLGGIVSGAIILNPPEGDGDPGDPIASGDILHYHEAASLFSDLTNVSTDIQEQILPRVTSILTEIDIFLARLNDPSGDTQVMMSKLRETAELLMAPEGELRNTLKLANEFAEILTNRENIIMQLLHDEQLIPALQEAVENMRQVTRNSVTIAKDTEEIINTVKGTSQTASETMTKNLPHVETILRDFMAMQTQILALLSDVQIIVDNISETSASMPSLMGDVQTQLRELEDITEAVKNISIIQWNLEEDTIEDPVLLKPLLLKQNKMPGQEDARTKEE